MTQDQNDLFEVASTTLNKETADILKNGVDWGLVKSKLDAKIIDNLVIFAMSTEKIPDHFDEKQIQKQYIALYKEYLTALCNQATNVYINENKDNQ